MEKENDYPVIKDGIKVGYLETVTMDYDMNTVEGVMIITDEEVRKALNIKDNRIKFNHTMNKIYSGRR